MDQERKNLQSTKRSKANPLPPVNANPAAPPTRTNLFICAIIEAIDKIYSDLTGKFPVQSALGNKYILIVYHYNANTILVGEVIVDALMSGSYGFGCSILEGICKVY